MNDGRKICILAPRFPVPEIAGDAVRVNNIAKQLKRQGFTLVLVSFADTCHPDIEGAEKIYDKVLTVRHSKFSAYFHTLTAMFSGKPMQRGYYRSADFRKKLKEVVESEKPDLFLAHMTRMTSYLEDLHVEGKSIVEMSDAFSLKYRYSLQTKGFSVMKLISRIERKLIYRYERQVLENFPRVVLVSQADVDYLQKEFPHMRSLICRPNGVDCAGSVSKNYDCHKIVFIGNMRSLQNQDAVTHFAEEILPKIKKEMPETVFHVVGGDVPEKLERRLREVDFRGYIDNLGEEISSACLTVAPMTIATGIQNKVLVSMANGVPVVISPRVAKGMPDFIDGTHGLLGETDEKFAENCLRLMKDGDLRQKIGQNAYDLMKENYSWKKHLEHYVD